MRQQNEFRLAEIGVFDCIEEGWSLIKNEYWLFLGMFVVALLIASSVPLYILMGPMHCGLFYSLLRRKRGEPVEFADVFKGFDFFGQSLLATLIAMSPILILSAFTAVTVLIAVFTSEALRGVDYEMSPAMLVFVFVQMGILILMQITIQGLTMFMYPLIMERNLKAWDAIKLSSRAVWHNAWGVTLLLLGQGLVGLLGFLCCVVGIYLVIPVIYASSLVAYTRIFGVSAASSQQAS